MKHLKHITTPIKADSHGNGNGDMDNIIDKIIAPILDITLGEVFGKNGDSY